MLGRKTEMSGMKKRQGPTRMTQGVNQIEPEMPAEERKKAAGVAAAELS